MSGSTSSCSGSVTSEIGREVDKRAVNRPSTYLVDCFHPNPIYDQVEALYDVLQDVDFDVDITMFLDEDGELDEEAYLEYMEQHYGDQIDDVIDKFEETPERPPAMPPAPSPAIIYNRVEDAEVLDLGSGDCSKLSRCQAKSIVATDKFPEENRHYPVEELDAGDVTTYLQKFKTEKVLTSYNVLTQLPSLEEVKLHDGLHLYPCTEFMRDTMGTVELADGRLYSKGRVGKEYLDFQHKELAEGVPISPGYRAMNWFKHEKIRATTAKRAKFRPFECPIDDIQYRLPDLLATRKFDGVCMLLQLFSDGSGHINMRNGQGCYINHDRDIQATLLVEKLPKVGPPQAFALLRIVKYKNFYPLHGTSTLENFAKEVDLRLNGIKIYGPLDKNLENFDYDGWIYRINEQDYRYKEIVTIDTSEPLTLAESLENEYGFDVKFKSVVTGVNVEYEIRREGDSFLFIPIGVREDKTCGQNTSVEKTARMMRWL